MATLREIDYSIRYNMHEGLYDPVDVLLRINNAVTRIAAGIKLPDGRVSPPLPDLYSSGTVATGSGVAVVSLPSTYQRNLFNVVDSNKDRVPPPNGGDYYSFQMFTRRSRYKDLSETGSVYMACVKGTNLYYQAIPSSSVNLGVYFYRKPVPMSAKTDEPDGIPEEYALDIVKNYVLADVYGDHLGHQDKAKEISPKFFADKRQLHLQRVYEIADEMMQFVGEAEGDPEYYAYEEGRYDYYYR
mgnify:CR=1 FL=1